MTTPSIQASTRPSVTCVQWPAPTTMAPLCLAKLQSVARKGPLSLPRVSQVCKCGTQVSDRRRNPSSVYKGYGPAAFTPVRIPITGTLPLLDLGRVCCAK